MYQKLLRVLALASFGLALSAVGCHSDSSIPDDAAGSVGLALQGAPGVTLAAFSYSIAGPGGFSQTGTVDVSASAGLSALIGPLPAGPGFTITVTASNIEGTTTCGGSASFSVTAHAVTSVAVHLQCHEAPRTGSVSIEGSLNVCPVIDGLSASPSERLVGGTALLAAAAHDTDGGPAALTFHWTTTGGSLTGADGPSPSLTCTAAGAVTVTLAVSDGDCADTMSTTITCTGTAAVRINEVESNGGVPGDWVELYNSGTAPADISGWKFKDNDDSHAFYVIPAGTIVAPGGFYVLEEAAFVFGLGGADSARLWDASGAPVDSYTWTAHATTTYGRCPEPSGPFTTTAASTKGAANACDEAPDAGAGIDMAPPADAGSVGTAQVVINEVESNGGVPGDWAELYNAGAATADISGWKFKDNDDTHAFYVIPAGTQIPPGGYYVLEEAAFVFGLGAADSTRLFDASGMPVDSYSWLTHATTTYGRCPNGTGAFTTTASSTKGAANDCGGGGGTGGVGGTGGASGAGGTGAAGAGGTGISSDLPWPGTDPVVTVDVANTFGTNLSGLNYQPATDTAPAVMWAIQNGPSKLYRLLWNGNTWTSDPANDWTSGKLLHYPDGLHAPDSEGLSKAEWTDSAIYVSTERDNDNNGVSRLSVLRFDTNAAGAELRATNEWNLTADLPVVGPNLGLEAITYVPDSALVAGGFFDEATHAAYDPATYPNHGTGLFFVGLEGNGSVYGYALDHVTNAFTRVATFASGQVSIMDLAYDREVGYLWGYCDNTCGNKATVFRLDNSPTSATAGRFQVSRVFDHPASLPDSNNEGITFAPQAECTAGQRSFFWSDDDQLDGHAIRRGSIPCGAFF